MRLGVVMMGTGVHAAACVGVMEELERRQAQPFAVCGMYAGAWTAALAMAGYDADRMRGALMQAARLGPRLLRPACSGRGLLRGTHAALAADARLTRMLGAQTGGRVLSACARPGAFVCRAAKSGAAVVFSSRAYAPQNGVIVTLQASVGFAARAAMGTPPFLAPLDWIGMPLLPHEDVALACRQLELLGAQRVLVVAPQPSMRRELDALELATQQRRWFCEDTLPERTAVLRVNLPEEIGALSLSSLPACAEAGRQAARAGLDGAFERMGMAFCRVLPFRRIYGGV